MFGLGRPFDRLDPSLRSGQAPLTTEERALADLVLDLWNDGYCQAPERDYWLKYVGLEHVKRQIRERDRLVMLERVL